MLALLAGGAVLFPCPAMAGSFRSTSGVSVTTGDYGTSEDTTITQLYETFVAKGQVGEIGVTLPYLFRNGNGVTVGESRRAQSGTIPEEADGIGDVQVTGTYFWLEEDESRPAVDLAGRVKFPTADDDEGLGTGRFDVGFGPELLKHFGQLITFADFELVLRDKPDNSTIKSTRFDYSLGVGYPLTDRFTGYASLDGGTPTNSGADAPLELVLSAVYKATETVHLNGFLLAGLTEGSPDFGAGTSVTFYF
ncbi:MAG: transporter [Candidatus Omnitrophota bacterium]|nr:transporter [Candidatus Omnitrophota bacterium]